MFVNKADGQLQAAHIILGYTPISFAFQAPKSVIKANDPRLPHISVAYEGFVIPEDTTFTQPLLVGILSVGASSSQPVTKEKEEEREREEEENPEGIVTLSESSDEFEVFNKPLSPKSTSTNIDYQQQVDDITSDEMSIQRKSQRSLLDLIES